MMELKNHASPYLALSEEFIIREVSRGNFLLIKWTAENESFRLEKTQKDIFELLDGTKTQKDIIKICSSKNIDLGTVKKFLARLRKQKIIKCEKNKTQKTIIKNLPQGIHNNLRFVQWEIAGQCNMRCRHCYNKYFIGNPELPTEKCKDIIKELNELNTLGVQITGGEPLLRKDIFEIMEYLEKNKIFIRVIFSNATLLTENMVRKLNSLKSGFSFIFSFDGPDEESYDFIRGKGQFKKFFKKINLINKIEKNLAANVMIHRKNFRKTNLLIRFILEKFPKIKRIRIGTFNRNEQGGYGNDKNIIGLSLQEELETYNKIISTYLRNKLDSKIELELSNFFRSSILQKDILEYDPESHPCAYVEGLTFTIKSNGLLQWCPTLYQLTFGNLKNTTVNKAMKTKKYRNFANLQVKNLSKCRHCEFVKICGGGCRAMVYPKIFQNDPIACQTMRFLKCKTIPLFPKNIQRKFISLLN